MKKITPITALLSLLIFYSNSASAFSWNDLWLTKDQQAFKHFQKKETKIAAEKFVDNNWKSVAHYRAGDYENSAETLNQENSITAHYNRGNALALSNRFEEAIDAYNTVLSLNSEHSDATFNKELLEKLMQEQEKNQNQEAPQDFDQNAEEEPQDDQQEQAEDKKNQNKKDQNSEQSTKNNEKKEPQTQQSSEKDQSSEQWLRQIPDDPGGLLKQKFLRDYLKRKHSSSNAS